MSEDNSYCRLCASHVPPHRLQSFADAPLFAAVGRVRPAIRRSDGLPQAACLDCVQLLNAADGFLRRVDAAQLTLAIMFPGPCAPSVKQEQKEESDFSTDVKPSGEDTRIDRPNEKKSYLKIHCIKLIPLPNGNPVEQENRVATEVCDDHNSASTSQQSALEIPHTVEDGQNSASTSKLSASKIPQSVKSYVKPNQNYQNNPTSSDYNPIEPDVQLVELPGKLCMSPLNNNTSSTPECFAPIKSEDPLLHQWSDYFCCKRCQLRTKTLQEMREHSWKAHKRCVIFKCVTCPQKVTTFKRFIRHLSNHHISLTQCCEYCNERFVSNGDVLMHKKLVHADEHKPHRCGACGTGFDSSDDLQLHRDEFILIKMRDAGDRRFKCDQCNKEFLNKITLESHLDIHDPTKNVCTICKKRFTSKYNLKQHMSSIHDPMSQVICQICGKSFKRESLLREHIAVHKGIKPHACTLCDKKFAKKATLIAHAATHTGLRQHICNICGKAYKYINGLKLHLQMHDNIKPYSCEICVKSFFNWPNYNKHMKRMHSKDMSKRTIIDRCS